MRENILRTRFAQKKININGWISIGSPLVAEYFGSCGFDSVTVDLQHGLFSIDTAVPMLQAISATNAIPLARCSDNNLAEINKLLDAGAYGIICPLVNTKEDAEKFVHACHYAPRGGRSYGPARGMLYGGPDYFTHANKTILTLAMIETCQGLAAAQDILSVPDLDGIYIGPSDLAIDMGFAPDGWKNAPVDDAIRALIKSAHDAGKYVGIFAGTTEMATRMQAYGVDMVSPGTDIQMLNTEITQRLQALRQS